MRLVHAALPNVTVGPIMVPAGSIEPLLAWGARGPVTVLREENRTSTAGWPMRIVFAEAGGELRTAVIFAFFELAAAALIVGPPDAALTVLAGAHPDWQEDTVSLAQLLAGFDKPTDSTAMSMWSE